MTARRRLLGALLSATLTAPLFAIATPLPGLAATPAHGSTPVGQTSYPVPAGAIHVATTGSDASSGSTSSPKRTLRAAVQAAPSGGTVVVHAGVYHQGETEIYKPLTVQSAPGEAVWFDGSRPVTGWTQTGSVWKAPWSVQWDHSAAFTKGQNDPSFIDPAHPMAAWPDQLFLDGKQLEQVPLSGSVGVGQFAVDYANKQIVTGSNPAGHEMRGSDLDRLFTVGSPDVTLRGFGIRRYANALPRLGVIFMARQRDVVSNVVVEDVASTGITMTSDGKNGAGTVDHVTLNRTGLAGIGAKNFDGGRVTNSAISNNNTEGFTPLPATAGIKVTASRNVVFDNNELTNNRNTNGIWTDESVVGVQVTRNRVVNANQDGFAGIQLELTSSAVVADNVVSGNKRGIYLFDSNHLRVVNNTVWNSKIGDITLDQDFRRQSNPAHNGHDPRYPAGDLTNTWITGDVTLENNVLGTDSNASNSQLWVLDKDKAIPAGQMLTTATGNVFEAKDASSPTLVAWGRLDGTVELRNDLDAWSATVGRGWVNKTYPANQTPAQATATANALGHGAALDADIASRVGQPAGSRHIGAFQQP